MIAREQWWMTCLLTLMTGTVHGGESPWLPGTPRGGEQLVVNHQPHRTGGLTSDTEFLDDFEVPFWQRVADDFRLNTRQEISRVAFWGFYGSSFSPAPDPPELETMRVRFYDARPGDGFPGKVLFEEVFHDPLRLPTGEHVRTGDSPLEYIFDVSLSSPFVALGNTPYWLEVAQIGDLESFFRWEYSRTDTNGQVAINEGTGDWRHTVSITSDTAYQLWAVPEPATCLLVCLGVCLVNKRRKGGALKD